MSIVLDAARIRETVRDLGYVVRDPDKVRTLGEEAQELRHERGRLLLASTFSLVSLLLMAVGMWLGLIQVPLTPWLALALATMSGPGRYIKLGAFAGLLGGLLGLFVSDAFPAPDFFGRGISHCRPRYTRDIVYMYDNS